MNDNLDNEMDACQLPHLADIFEKLRMGYHITDTDGKIHSDLDKYFESYKKLFSNLGFTLISHRCHFFYFKGDNKLGEQARQMSVFMFILIEWLSDKNAEVEAEVGSYNLNDLPHLKQERYTEYLKQVKITDLDGLKEILGRMEKLGFVNFIDNKQSFRFRTSVYRFLDICLEISQESSEHKL